MCGLCVVVVCGVGRGGVVIRAHIRRICWRVAGALVCHATKYVFLILLYMCSFYYCICIYIAYTAMYVLHVLLYVFSGAGDWCVSASYYEICVPYTTIYVVYTTVRVLRCWRLDVTSSCVAESGMRTMLLLRIHTCTTV